MHENKFEKQVREKMDGLGFDPSDAVWTQVDQAVHSEKKRRRPIFWIFFLSGLLIAGGAGYFTFNHFSPINNSTIKPTLSPNTNQDPPQNKSNETEKTPVDQPGQQEQPDRKSSLSVGRNSGSFQSGTPELVQSERKSLTKTGNTVTTIVDKKNMEQQPDKFTQVPAVYQGADSNTNSKVVPQGRTDEVEKLNKTHAADSVSVTAKEKKTEIKQNPWSIGFTGSLGISNINQSLFHSLNPSNFYYAANYPSTSVSGPSAVLNTTSDTRAGFSFAVGVSVNRKLSKRISASAGLGYHYYSSTIQTGTAIPVDSALTFYSRYALNASVNSFYRNGQGKEFTNQYHFIELPVNLSFQLNKSRKNPVNWEAGFSLAWLVSANALQFDPYTNVYFKNNQLFNRIQWNVASAILIGFPVQNHSLQLGPQIQYSVTSLLKDNTSYPGHLIYFGLKCSFNR